MPKLRAFSIPSPTGASCNDRGEWAIKSQKTIDGHNLSDGVEYAFTFILVALFT